MTRAAAAGGVLAAFVVLAILNSGGYRYAASDQAFYIPAILRSMDPGLFPRDRALLAAQDRLMLVDDVMAEVVEAGGASLEHVLFAAYLVALVAVAGSGWLLARSLFQSRWTAAALVLAMSIRHRIPKTGVNTLEHYFHPRLLAFAIGVAGLAALARQRTWLALGCALAAAALHPTTGLWFGVLIGAGGLALARSRVAWAICLTAAAALGVAWLALTGGLTGRLVAMDPEWLAILASKDYLFPTAWSAGTWALHLLYVAVVAVSWRARLRRGLAGAGESALIAGLAALLALFLLALPFTHLRVALAVQLQVSRIFWLFDLLAVAYAAWWLVEARWIRKPATAAAPASGSSLYVRRWAVAVVAAAALARGSYVMLVEKAGNPVVQLGLADDAWRDVMAWVRTRPRTVHVLADPGHAWRFGSSVRVAAGRDLYLEEVKDAALAMYSRDVAMRVLERTRALGPFDRLTTPAVRHLARRHDLDLLVTERRFDLPLLYRNERFRVYELDSP